VVIEANGYKIELKLEQ
jgi:hypothetical protein